LPFSENSRKWLNPSYPEAINQMDRDSIFSGFRANLFPQGNLGEFWQGVSRALVWFVLITGLWLGYAGVRIVMSFSWEPVVAMALTGSGEPLELSHLAYAYEVDGERYSGSRFYFGGNSFSNKLPDDREVFFNPGNPAQSVVYRRYSSSHAGFFLLMIGALIARSFIHRNYAR
jgi:hypothetical protein